ncbi:MAG TPA: GNAT family N-acetyltransferase [Hyphomicrobiales bacterium]|nr:GNAT family N-acetyltransferase [Hyphomicrobiales bacterium]
MSTPFEHTTHQLGPILLRPLRPEHTALLANAMSAMPPWSVIGFPAERMVRAFTRVLPSVFRFEIIAEDKPAGMVAIQNPFLHGPYLQVLAILPEFQGRKFGWRILEWMEGEARQEQARQLWLCVSTFNTGAQRFYRRFGFQEAAMLDKLASDGSDEILMRKRLSYEEKAIRP